MTIQMLCKENRQSIHIFAYSNGELHIACDYVASYLALIRMIPNEGIIRRIYFHVSKPQIIMAQFVQPVNLQSCGEDCMEQSPSVSSLCHCVKAVVFLLIADFIRRQRSGFLIILNFAYLIQRDSHRDSDYQVFEGSDPPKKSGYGPSFFIPFMIRFVFRSNWVHSLIYNQHSDTYKGLMYDKRYIPINIIITYYNDLNMKHHVAHIVEASGPVDAVVWYYSCQSFFFSQKKNSHIHTHTT